MICLFALVTANTPIAVIAVMAFGLGFVSSLQFTSMNTLVFADVPVGDTSGASSLSSAMQQLSISFGIAVASLLAVLFLRGRHGEAHEVATAVRHAFIALGVITVFSSGVFRQLRPEDGRTMSPRR
jgi:hypothetical protein